MTEGQRIAIDALQPDWSARVRASVRGSTAAMRLARVLASPAADGLVAEALGWFAERELSDARKDSSLDDALADLLAKLVSRDQLILRRRSDAGDHARTVLNGLIGRQNTIALQLSSRLAGG